MTYEEVVAQMTGPGGPFEIETVPVQGRPMKNWKYRERSMREKVERAANFGDATFMVHGERRITYAEFPKLVWGAAGALQGNLGLKKGDRLAVLAYNSPDWLATLFGATSVGGVGVGLNGWWTAEEIAYGLTDSGARFLVVVARHRPRAEAKGTVPVAELLKPSDAVPTVPLDEDDPFVFLYTSGTTGRPKACITTQRGTIAQVMGIMFASIANVMLGNAKPLVGGDGGQPAGLLTSPLFHVAGLHSGVCTLMSTGAKIVFTQGKFDPEAVMQLIQKERVTLWGAIPTMLHRVVHHEKVKQYDLSSLKSISFGGAPTPPETIEKAREVLPIEPSMANAYGLTETHGVATTNAGSDLLRRRTAVGRPLPVLELKIVDDKGDEVPTGQLGELLFYGPTITPGYWNKPEATADTVRAGWLHTGDLGYRDPDGFFFVVDRKKDMLIRGGENVYCTEIEHCLADHPEIVEAAVIGVPDPELGERVKAIVRRTPGSTLDVKGVQRHVGARLAAFKVPEFVDFTDKPLPRNPAGKLLKNVLRGQGTVPFDTSMLE
jgi:acyl-CoA synthetase (AMP-forming)/AMP-acid ligase II